MVRSISEFPPRRFGQSKRPYHPFYKSLALFICLKHTWLICRHFLIYFWLFWWQFGIGLHLWKFRLFCPMISHHSRYVYSTVHKLNLPKLNGKIPIIPKNLNFPTPNYDLTKAKYKKYKKSDKFRGGGVDVRRVFKSHELEIEGRRVCSGQIGVWCLDVHLTGGAVISYNKK